MPETFNAEQQGRTMELSEFKAKFESLEATIESVSRPNRTLSGYITMETLERFVKEGDGVVEVNIITKGGRSTIQVYEDTLKAT